LELPETDEQQIKQIVQEICDKLLVNTVIETYTYQIIS
ncbi:MAG: phosphoribosylformylglycinamidine synthase, partial [Proteobacteria bacterium]|nr:phosphoribosylformylglycinamidine synthase [Pseudomonadota bacterium]